MADEHHAIAGLDAGGCQKPRGACRQFTHVGIGVLFVAAVAFDAHGDAGRVAFSRSFKKFQQIAIGVNALWLCAHVFFERWKYPLLQTGQVNV